MKKLFKTFSMLLAAAAVMTATSCSDDLGKEIGQNAGLEEDETTPSVYVGVNFTMPSATGSRSFTDGDNSSNDGVEVGTDAENNVSEVLLVLANPADYSYIASATVPKRDIYKHGEEAATNTSAYHAKAKFTKNQLSQYYFKKGTEEYEDKDGKVLVFVFVNPSGNIVKALNDADFGNIDWIQTKGEVVATGMQTEGSIWTANNFLMSNSSIDMRYIPKKFTDWNKYSTSSHYYNLSADNDGSETDADLDNSKGGAIDVIRAAARMDFKDGSPKETDPNTYQVIFEDDENGEPDRSKPVIDIYLNKMCLVNMNNSFYYLKRVSNKGLDTGAPEAGATTFDPAAAKAANGWELCGPEKPWFSDENGTALPNSGNYVVDAWAEVKYKFADLFGDDDETYPFDYLTYFNYPFFDPSGILDDNTTQGSSNDNERWYVSQISDVLKGDKDNWKTQDYHVWRYLTENTIPSPDGNQVNGISTGVVFKGKMLIDKKAEKVELPENQYSSDYFNAKAHNDLIDAINMTSVPDASKDPILYSIGGDIYAGWDNLRMAAIFSSISISLSPDQTQVIVDWNRENSLYQAVFGQGGTGYSFTATVKELLGGTIGEDDENSTLTEVTYTDPLDADSTAPDALWKVWAAAGYPADGDVIINFKKAATGNDITLYQRSSDNVDGNGYYCYYYYWNRHNDNGNDGVMGPMEFAVVRNNVYKLAVTEIKKLGHPRVPLNDPESPTPNTPDEKENVYITVDAKVLPWVVRVNNIKF